MAKNCNQTESNTDWNEVRSADVNIEKIFEKHAKLVITKHIGCFLARFLLRTLTHFSEKNSIKLLRKYYVVSTLKKTLVM